MKYEYLTVITVDPGRTLACISLSEDCKMCCLSQCGSRSEKRSLVLCVVITIFIIICCRDTTNLMSSVDTAALLWLFLL